MSRFAPIVVLLLTAACVDTTGPALDAERSTSLLADRASSRATAESVSGSAHHYRTVQNDAWFTISLHATKALDGSVKGSFHWRSHLGRWGSKVSGDIVCLAIDGDQAWLAGVFTKANNSANVGKWASFRVIDNGEGSGNPPDEFGVAWRGDPTEGNLPGDFCRDRPIDQAVDPIDAGNLQVRRHRR